MKKHHTRSVAGGTGTSLKVKLTNDKHVPPRQKVKSVVTKVPVKGKGTSSKTSKAAAKSKTQTSTDIPVPPTTCVDPPVPPAGVPQQTAFADAMRKWRNSMISAINAFPDPSGNNNISQNEQGFSAATQDVQRGDGLPSVALHGTPGMVGPRDPHSRHHERLGMVDPQSATHHVPPTEVEVADWSDEETDPTMQGLDCPPPPPPGRPAADTGAAVSAPQSALDLVTPEGAPGKTFTFLLSKHVPDNIRRRIWANRVVDFAFLLQPDPHEDETLEFVRTGDSNALSLRKTKAKGKVDNWIAWNKALRVFTEIYCMKYPNRCMPLLQYSGLLNNLSSKFPFDQVYAYDKEFRADLQWNPNKQWNVIDTQLWSMCLHGIHTLPHQGNPRQYTFKKPNRSDTRARPTQGTIKHCFDHNRGGCFRPSCVFPHICGNCGASNHITTQCRVGSSSSYNSQQQQTKVGQDNTSSTSIPNRGGIRAANTAQSSKTSAPTTQVSRQ